MFPHQKLDWNVHRLDKHLESAPDDVAARLEAASVCLSRAWFHDGGEVWLNRALTHARRVQQGDPGSAGALVVAGLALVGLDRLEPASRYLDEALRLDPERADVHFGLAALHRQAGDRHQAVREAEAACRLAPESWEPHWLLARLLSERADELRDAGRLLERSQFHAVRALQLGPSPSLLPQLLHDLGLACLRTGRLEEAHKLFARLTEHDKYASKARWYLGLVLYQMGKYKNAILHLRQHLEDQPDNPRVHARIGMSYLHLGEVTKARESCNRALAVEPSDVQARWTLGCAWLEEGRVDEATRLFREILVDSPDHLPAFTELVRLRRSAGDVDWLRHALRSEVAVHDRLPLDAQREHPLPGLSRDVRPRSATRERVHVLLQVLAEMDVDAVGAILEAMDLSTDEGLRFALWEAALDQLAARRAGEARGWLEEPGRSFSAAAGRDVLTLAAVLPEPLLTKGLAVREEDLKRAAVDRHGPARDVGIHRQNVERERQEARAWQALLLLAIATKRTRSARNLLVRWATDADTDLAEAARAALATTGDAEAAEHLRRRAEARNAAPLAERLLAQASPPETTVRPRPASHDEALRCTTCGRRAPEVDHLMAGGEAAICDQCVLAVARDRRELAVDDPAVSCRLCNRTALESRDVYVYRGTAVCAACVDQSLGLLEREEVDRYLASW